MPRTKQPPAELRNEIATTRDGRDITQPWIAELQEARDPLLSQAADWGVYDRIFRDDQVKSCWQQRTTAVVSREWDVIPGGDAPIDQECADALADNLERIGLDRPTEKMLKAVFNGYSVAELMWEYHAGRIEFARIHVRNARRFRFDKENRLRLLTSANMHGELLPPRKFWVVRSGGDDDDEVYGRGLAWWLYWPCLFKRNGIGFWQTFLDKFGQPTAVGKYRPGTPQADIDRLLGALQAIATDSGIVVPEGMAIELLEAARSGTTDYSKLAEYMDAAIAKVILSQTMTTDDGSSLSQAKVHAGVKLEVVRADADLLCESFNSGPAAWYRDLNFPTAAAPKLIRLVDEEEDLKESAEIDEALSRLGYRRTEESFKDIYGDGYERKPEPKATPAASASGQVVDPKKRGLPVVGNPKASGEGQDEPVASFAAGDLRTLYVSRRVENAADIIAWAKKAGIRNLHPAKDLHVTIAFSRRAVDWMKIDPEWNADQDGRVIIQPGGPRRVDEIAPGGPAVLLFSSNTLRWRHEAILAAGASWDFKEYHPHITLSDAPDAPLAEIEAYQGPIVLGPEKFEELDADWQPDTALKFAEAAARQDELDAAVAQAMVDDGWREDLGPIVEPLLARLKAASSFAEAETVLAQLSALDTDPMAERLARATFAARFPEAAQTPENTND